MKTPFKTYKKKFYREASLFFYAFLIFGFIISAKPESKFVNEQTGYNLVLQSPRTNPDSSIPPKSEWKAEASSLQENIYPAKYAIDGNVKTRWSSAQKDTAYLIIDMGRPAITCGLTILWENAYSVDYSILVSKNKKSWERVYYTNHGDGGTDDIYFRPVTARYIKILGTKRATGWGHSIWEVNIKGLSEWPVVTTEGKTASDPLNMFDGKDNTMWQAGKVGAYSLKVDLRKEKPFSGIRIDWGNNYATEFSLSISHDGKKWEKTNEIKDGTGKFDILACKLDTIRFMRLDFKSSKNNLPIQIREIRLRGPKEVLSPLVSYQIAAEKSKPGLYPDQLRRRQVYWTIIGMPENRKVSLFDEYGNVEPKAKGSSIMPYIFTDNKLISAFNVKISQQMADGYLPVPSVIWKWAGLKLEIDAVASGDYGKSMTFVRYKIINTTNKQQKGKLFLAIRPVQINPIWQYGGLSPIHSIQFKKETGGQTININGEDLYISLSHADAFGAMPFNNGDIARELIKGKLPDEQNINHGGEYISGALEYEYDIKPGGFKTVVIAMPLHNIKSGLKRFAGKNSTEIDAAFDIFKSQEQHFWQKQIHHKLFLLPDTNIADMLDAQIGYILINADSVALQPGSRNYNRSWMRDGSQMAEALLYMGRNDVVRKFLNWYSERIYSDGLVPPVLNNDGTVNKGFGSNLEYDSQGEFIYAMLEYFYFSRDTVFLKNHYDKIKLALNFLVKLREKTLAPGYLKNKPARDRFVGILPPSISHEGYGTPMHSYFDDFYALKGWKDGKIIAGILGDPATAAWAEKQYKLLRTSVKTSIEKTMEYKNIKYIPGCADKGDLDPTSTSVAFSPCDEADILPHKALSYMYGNYYKEVVNRTKPGFGGGYTPYEIRNISAFIQMGKRDNALFLLHYFDSCSRPKNWNEFAEVVLANKRLGSYIGDMPHSWVGATYVTTVRDMVVRESGNKLILFQGVPEEWVNKRKGIKLQNLPTHFGKLTLSAFAKDNTLTIKIDGNCKPPKGYLLYWPFKGTPEKVIVDGKQWKDFNKTLCHLPASVKNIVVKW